MGSDLVLIHPGALVFEREAKKVIEERRSPHTRAAYYNDVDRWIGFARSRGLDPSNPSPREAAAYRIVLEKGFSRATARRGLAALSSIYQRLLARGIVPGNPFHPDVLEWPPADRVGKTPVVSDEIAGKMLDSAHAADPFDYAILRVLYDTGLRRMSVVSLRRDRIQILADGSWQARVTIKGDYEADVVLPPTSVSALESWLSVAPESLFVFPAARNPGKGLTRNRVNDVVERYAAAVGAKVHPHVFRASFITAAYDNNLPEREIQAAVHHADPRTTQRYDRRARGGEVTARLAEARKKVSDE